jgi:4-diphosphocytidyl-2-C-methyl-D-erythritol kinase
VYAQFDRLGLARSELDPEALRELAAASPEWLAAGVENDLQAAALSLRPELEDVLAELAGAGASGTLVAGSGPTCCGVFTELGDAQLACSRIEDALVAVVRR